jgi:hypothetical protein
LNDPYEKAYLIEIMPNKKFKTILRYRASRDGWLPKDFHRKSDGKKPTVSFFKIKENGQCIGGFTSAYWSSPPVSTMVTDSTAMIFNLTTKKLFKSKFHSEHIVCNKGAGPYFGFGELSGIVPMCGND